MFYIEVSKISYILKNFKVITFNSKSQLFWLKVEILFRSGLRYIKYSNTTALTSKLRYYLDQEYSTSTIYYITPKTEKDLALLDKIVLLLFHSNFF